MVRIRIMLAVREEADMNEKPSQSPAELPYRQHQPASHVSEPPWM